MNLYLQWFIVVFQYSQNIQLCLFLKPNVEKIRIFEQKLLSFSCWNIVYFKAEYILKIRLTMTHYFSPHTIVSWPRYNEHSTLPYVSICCIFTIFKSLFQAAIQFIIYRFNISYLLIYKITSQDPLFKSPYSLQD